MTNPTPQVLLQAPTIASINVPIFMTLDTVRIYGTEVNQILSALGEHLPSYYAVDFNGVYLDDQIKLSDVISPLPPSTSAQLNSLLGRTVHPHEHLGTLAKELHEVAPALATRAVLQNALSVDPQVSVPIDRSAHKM